MKGIERLHDEQLRFSWCLTLKCLSMRVCKVNCGFSLLHELGMVNLRKVSVAVTEGRNWWHAGHGDGWPLTSNLYSDNVFIENKSLGQWLSKYPRSSTVSCCSPELRFLPVTCAKCCRSGTALTGDFDPCFAIMKRSVLITSDVLFELFNCIWNSGMCLSSWMMLFREHIFLSSGPFLNGSNFKVGNDIVTNLFGPEKGLLCVFLWNQLKRWSHWRVWFRFALCLQFKEKLWKAPRIHVRMFT